MAGGKIIPIIAAGDQAMRDDARALRDEVYASLVDMARAMDVRISDLSDKVDRTLAEFIAMQEAEEKEEGVSPRANG